MWETVFTDDSLNVRSGQSAIYGLIDPNRNEEGVRYVGKTNVSIEVRRLTHVSHGKQQRTDGTHLERWLAKLHREGVEPVAICLQMPPPELLDYYERWWIRHLRSIGFDLVNTADGGTGGHLKTAKIIDHSAVAKKSWETRRRLGKTASPNKGKKQTPEEIAKRISKIDYAASHAKRLRTIEERKAAGTWNPKKPPKGNKHTPESKRKLSEAAKRQAAEGRMMSGEARSAAMRKAWETRRRRASETCEEASLTHPNEAG